MQHENTEALGTRKSVKAMAAEQTLDSKRLIKWMTGNQKGQKKKKKQAFRSNNIIRNWEDELSHYEVKQGTFQRKQKP